jgi:hypothetical protein
MTLYDIRLIKKKEGKLHMIKALLLLLYVVWMDGWNEKILLILKAFHLSFSTFIFLLSPSLQQIGFLSFDGCQVMISQKK